MEDSLKQSFQKIISDFGPDVINDKNLANIVADYFSFDRNPAVRNILKAIVSDGYATKISQLKTSKGDPSIDLERYAGEIEQSWGYGKEQVRFVLSCIASSIGIKYKIDNSNKQNQQPISSPPNTPIVNNPISSNQNNQQTQKTFVHNKIKFLLWSLPIVFVLIGIIIWHNSSSSEEDRLALDHAKECYDRGDYNTAFDIWEKYAKLDSVRGMNGLGHCYCQGKGVKQDYKEAMKWFQKAAEQGLAHAQCNLGVMYCYGYGVPVDYEEAHRWFKKAADQGLAEAQFHFGVMYRYGYGVPVDYEEAFKWYTKAAEQGLANAQFHFGVMYYNGQGVPVDYEEAHRWFKKAADQGLAEAQYSLGNMYYNGQDVPVDYEEARKWYTNAAEQGYVDAQYSLGVMYYNGQGVPVDYEEARKWYANAAEQGDADAQCNLGVMYCYGYGVPVDYDEAFKWYTKAAEQGLANAQCNLGIMYCYGYGVPVDYEEAFKWFIKAAEQGNTAAQKILKEVEAFKSNHAFYEPVDSVFADVDKKNVFTLVYATSDEGFVNIYEQPTSKARIIGKIDYLSYSSGLLLEDYGEWCKVSQGTVTGYAYSKFLGHQTWYNGKGSKVLVAAHDNTPIYEEFYEDEGNLRIYTRVPKGTIIADHYEENNMYYELRTGFNSWYVRKQDVEVRK